MPTSLPQRPAPAFPNGATRLGSGIAWTLTPVGDSKLFRYCSPQGNTPTVFFQLAARKGSGEKNRPGVRREDVSVGHREGEEISPQCRKKSESRAGPAHSRAPGRQTLARSSSELGG